MAAELGQRRGAGPLELAAQRVEVRRGGERRQPRPALAARAQLRVDLEDRAPQATGAVGGDQLDRAGVGPTELLERRVEGDVGEPFGVLLVEHRELRVEPGVERVRAQQPRAEGVDRRDPGALGGARRVVGAELAQAHADPLAQLGRRLLGERDREDLPPTPIPSSSTARAKRSTSTDVLPLPAPASSSSSPSRRSIASICSSVKTPWPPPAQARQIPG